PTGFAVAGGWRTLFTVSVADTWKVLPMVSLILLAGLEAIPGEVHEAADVDGAGGWRRVWYVALPLLLPYVTSTVLLRAIAAFRIFERALVLAGRVEPVLGPFVWSRYAPPASDPFTAAAAAMVLFVIILGFTTLYLRVSESRGAVEPRARRPGAHPAPPSDGSPSACGSAWSWPWSCSPSTSCSWCPSPRARPCSASVRPSWSPRRP